MEIYQGRQPSYMRRLSEKREKRKEKTQTEKEKLAGLFSLIQSRAVEGRGNGGVFAVVQSPLVFPAPVLALAFTFLLLSSPVP